MRHVLGSSSNLGICDRPTYSTHAWQKLGKRVQSYFCGTDQLVRSSSDLVHANGCFCRGKLAIERLNIPKLRLFSRKHTRCRQSYICSVKCTKTFTKLSRITWLLSPNMCEHCARIQIFSPQIISRKSSKCYSNAKNFTPSSKISSHTSLHHFLDARDHTVTPSLSWLSGIMSRLRWGSKSHRTDISC